MEDNFKKISKDLLGNMSLLAFEQSFNSVVITNADIDNPIVVYINPAFTKKLAFPTKK